MKENTIFFSCNEYFIIDENTKVWEPYLEYEDYLYRSRSLKAPFVIYEEELKRLNDYLFFLLKSSTEQKQEDVDSFSEIVVNNDFFIGDGEIEFAREEAELRWSFNINQTLFSLGITLLLSFLESNLLDLVKWQEPSINSKEIRGNKIESYLKILNKTLNANFTFPKQLVKSRKIRNKFIHNQLEYNSVQEKQLRYTIDEVVNLLFEIEDEMIKCGIL